MRLFSDLFLGFCVGDHDLLAVVGGVAAESKSRIVSSLKFHEQLAIMGPEALHHVRMHDHDKLTGRAFAPSEDGVDATLELYAHGLGALYHPATLAEAAGLVDGNIETLVKTLARHLHQ